MAYSKETKKAAQDAYHEARKFGHTKEEARQIRDNWKVTKPNQYDWCDDDYDDFYNGEDDEDEDFDQYDDED